MIEFKAVCGHTVRARDEDAGGIVRCSYCGRNANVPDNLDSDLDFLFRDVDQNDQDQMPHRGRRRKGRLSLFRRSGSAKDFDPFAVVFKLCYAAALIAIVVVVARKWVIPMFDEEDRSRRLSARRTDGHDAPTVSKRRERNPTNGQGLINRTNLGGLFAGSTPSGATVYCVVESKAPLTGRIVDVPGVRQFSANGTSARVPDGIYVVEVVFPWNDPRLSNPRLSDYRNYLAFRRAIEHASSERRKRLVEDYFVPDEASDAFIDQTADQIYIVRQYRGVEVRQARSRGVRSLFLPKIIPTGRDTFSAEPLVSGYLPTADAYRFDEAHVRNELAFYGVSVSDQPFVIRALARIGAIPYVTPDGRTRFFKIGVHDGAFASKVIRETVE